MLSQKSSPSLGSTRNHLVFTSMFHLTTANPHLILTIHSIARMAVDENERLLLLSGEEPICEALSATTKRR